MKFGEEHREQGPEHGSEDPDQRPDLRFHLDPQRSTPL